MSYRTLKTEFVGNLFNFKQVKRQKDIAIYKKWKDGYIGCNYEVIIIQRHDGYKIKDTYIEPSEFYPNSEQWGVMGWTYTKYEDAERKFNQIWKNIYGMMK